LRRLSNGVGHEFPHEVFYLAASANSKTDDAHAALHKILDNSQLNTLMFCFTVYVDISPALVASFASAWPASSLGWKGL
jgi:hypothetical protein